MATTSSSWLMHPLIRRAAALLFVVLSLAGCYTVRRVAVTPVPIVLVSPSPFMLYRTEATAADTARSCAAMRAEGAMSRVRGDTLFLSAARITAYPPRRTRCQVAGLVHVVLSDHPDLQAESYSYSKDRSALAGLGIAWATILTFGALLFVVAVMNWQGS